MKVRITFTEALLGTLAGNKEIATEFIASKHPDGVQEDEAEAIENVEESLEKASTIFWQEDGKPFLWDYQFKGFFKSACEAMISMEAHTQEELKKVRLTRYLYKKTIDKMIFVYPRKIFLQVPNNQKSKECERPLLGETMRGERVCLARSEELIAGTYVDIEILVLNEKRHKEYIAPWLDYGALMGMGQWRSSGKGRFKWELLEE